MSRTPTLSLCQSSYEAHAMGLDKFAESFSHTLQARYPILVVRVDGQLRAYGQMERRWLVTPAFHTQLNSPRDTLTITRVTNELLKQIAPGFLIQADPKLEHIFTPPIMAKLGMKPWPYRVYEAT